ncbi:MAG: hypothetical protein Q8M51_01645 [Polaromonas sp.]|uniref:hypothetical protein n=1 Tax=Polaromonas sp. TaxID=1869339 RepID=UPI00273121D1|nr:hypothetical protein [Polaromonas sp.]MDP1740100.1 hypothetical protein [Polaromonas sp.]MDP1955076.1 hypothetical protein [Polaromonas sp.]MDP3354553.1 hypothetical protein [Polaromonas sp.]MDP3752609.1 hypothetical protein [Polaromonas sp.]
MKPLSSHPTPSPSGHKNKGPQADGSEQQALAEKAANSPAGIKARIDSKNMPDKPPLDHQHTPNSSGRP